MNLAFEAAWAAGLIMAFTLFLISAVPAAEPLLPPSGACPWGYIRSGGGCIPTTSKPPQATERRGQSCPWGTIRSGGYCIKN